jgi:hypothetical protein
MTDTELPAPQAIGWVKGQVIDYDGNRQCKLILGDGSKIPCLLTGHPKFVKELVNGAPRVVTVYPGASQNKLFFKIVRPAISKKIGCFYITGTVKTISGGHILMLVWSERMKKGFPVIVHGFLKADRNEYWRIEAAVEDGELVLVDGVKLADAPAVKKREPIASL